MEIKELTYQDEHWGRHINVDSLYQTPESAITLYVNYTEIKIENLMIFFNSTNVDIKKFVS